MPKMSPFNLELTPELRTALDACAAKTGMSRGLILRYALTYYHAMLVPRVPTCANGQACFCPHMHTALLADKAPAVPLQPAQQAAVFPNPPAAIEPPKVA